MPGWRTCLDVWGKSWGTKFGKMVLHTIPANKVSRVFWKEQTLVDSKLCCVLYVYLSVFILNLNSTSEQFFLPPDTKSRAWQSSCRLPLDRVWLNIKIESCRDYYSIGERERERERASGRRWLCNILPLNLLMDISILKAQCLWQRTGMAGRHSSSLHTDCLLVTDVLGWPLISH